MIPKCSVFGCRHRQDIDKDVIYYGIPKVIKNQGEEKRLLTTERRIRWIKALGYDMTGVNEATLRICSIHFIRGMIIT